MFHRSKPLAALATLALIGAGCGSDAPSETRTAKPKQVTGQAKAVKFAACMRENGVRDFPDPNTKGADAFGVSVTPAVFTKAVDACKAFKPPGALSMKLTPKQQSAALRFAQCVRRNGVKDFPDPVSGQPLVDTTKIPSSNQPGGMTILNGAMHACRRVLNLASGGQR